MCVLAAGGSEQVDLFELPVPCHGVGVGYGPELAEDDATARVAVPAVCLRVQRDDRRAFSSGAPVREDAEHRDRRPAPRGACASDREPEAIEPIPADDDRAKDHHRHRPTGDPRDQAQPGHVRRDDALRSDHHQRGTQQHDGRADHAGQPRAVDWHRCGGRGEGCRPRPTVQPPAALEPDDGEFDRIMRGGDRASRGRAGRIDSFRFRLCLLLSGWSCELAEHVGDVRAGVLELLAAQLAAPRPAEQH